MNLVQKRIEDAMREQGATQEQIDRYFGRDGATDATTAESRGGEAGMPTDVAIPDSYSEDQIAALQKAEAAKEDPLGVYLQEAALQNQWERDQYEDQQARRDWLAQAGSGTLQSAGNTADQLNAAIVGNMIGQGTELGKEVDYGPYLGDASSDPNAAAWQYGAMDEFARRAQGGLTGIERAEMEMNRRLQERDLRGQREAQLRDMQMRGARSSGLEVAQMLGAQQNSAELMQARNLQQEANAQQRADRALGAGAALASDIRGQSFGESSFNKQLQNQYQNRQAAHRQSERNRQWSIVTDTSGAAAGAVSDFYNHQTQPVMYATNTALGNPVSQPTGSSFADATKALAGRDQADKAAKELEDDPILKIGPFEI